MHEKRALTGARRVVYGLSSGMAAAAMLGSLYGCSSPAPVAFERGEPEELKIAEDISLSHLEASLAPEKVDVRRGLRVSQVFVDELSMAHTRVQQVVDDVPIFGGEAIVHLNRDGSVFAVTDTLKRRIPRGFDTRPAFEPERAIEFILADYACVECFTAPPEADLWVLDREEQRIGPRLVYRVKLFREDGSEETSMPVIFIDAKTGEKVWEYNNLQTVQGTGATLYSGGQPLETYLKSGTYYMEDVSRKIGTFDFKNGTTTVSRLSDANNAWDLATQKAAADAHYGAAKTYDYFKNVHNRNGIDGLGGPAGYTSADGVTKLISSRVHYSTNYNNAYWNGTYMTYGDGDNSQFKPLVTLDICGHEMTHGITERTAKLVYSGESGALNESMSDVFGAMVERYAKGESANTWIIGEECYTPAVAGDALRYMENPHLATNSGFTTDDDPDHYNERYTGSGDNGGVHINSGIANKAFHLVAKGGSHHLGGSMVGIGPDDAAKIWYKALTTYMTSSTNFAGARTATLNAAAALFGNASAQYNAVAQAWTLVGVSDAAQPVACAHDKCTQGVALTSGCDPCVTQICSADPYCCNTKWDATCVSEVSSVCKLSCP
ncbi:MAG TPA: M4 family metallopeptidase [Polyangiaceae bacterium]|nr:M4 family metallopeptidase [Polyangiaceae bacterium]